jgi:hypothetical protein
LLKHHNRLIAIYGYQEHFHENTAGILEFTPFNVLICVCSQPFSLYDNISPFKIPIG